MKQHKKAEHVDPASKLLGAIAVRAAIEAGTREVFRVWVDRDRDDMPTRRLTKLCQSKDVRWSPAGEGKLDELAGVSSHAGVVAEVGPRRFEPAGDLIARCTWITMLDGIEDPYNFGHTVRALWAAGCEGVLVRPRNWAQGGPEAEAVIARSSAGATERIAMAITESPQEAMQMVKGTGDWQVVATGQGEGAVSYSQVDFKRNTLLLIGGEKRGLRRSFLSTVDRVVTVPYGRRFDAALGTVAAAAVLSFEVARQRGFVEQPIETPEE